MVQARQKREDRAVKTLQKGQDSRDRTTETGMCQDRHDDTAVTVHLGHDNGCDKGTKPPNRSVGTGKRGQDGKDRETGQDKQNGATVVGLSGKICKTVITVYRYT
jgi:hypothetical protein